MSIVVSISSDFSFSFNEDNLLFSTAGRDLCMEKGKIYGLYGANGVGKTTLLNVINAMLKPTTGFIAYTFQDKHFLFDSSTKELDVRLISNNIRRCFQVPLLIDEWSVLENILLVKRMYDQENRRSLFKKYFVTADDKANELLSLVDLSPHDGAGTLSYGQRRLLSNLQMLYCGAPLIILDEPFANLHEHVITALQNEYKRIVKKQNVTIIVVEHKRDVIEAFADRIFSINNKRLFFEDFNVES